jgi:hypothetical protein
VSGIRTHDHSVRSSEDSSCFRQRRHCDRLSNNITIRISAQAPYREQNNFLTRIWVVIMQTECETLRDFVNAQQQVLHSYTWFVGRWIGCYSCVKVTEQSSSSHCQSWEINQAQHILYCRQINTAQLASYCRIWGSVFFGTTPCRPLKVGRRFGGTCRLDLQSWIISQVANQGESMWQADGLHGVISQKMNIFAHIA